jgi:hypothetical protein
MNLLYKVLIQSARALAHNQPSAPLKQTDKDEEKF